MGNQKKKKNRSAAGEIYGVMNDCVRPNEKTGVQAKAWV